MHTSSNKIQHILAATFLTFALSGAAVAQTSTAAPAPAPIVEGQDYQVLKTAQPTEEVGKIEVTEFFSYGCPHCYHFEPMLNAWMKTLPTDVVVRRVPISFNPHFATVQRLYYALDALGIEKDLHSKVFDAIHKDNVDLYSVEGMVGFMEKQGVSREKFMAAYNAFGVQAKLNRADQMTRLYQIMGVPTLAVDGRYITSAHSLEGNITVANALITKVREQRAPVKPAAAGAKK
ncbi:MAG: thiol:disulfide interchange protein DsbA/DsbL [Burkholderiaceae bacterium]|nr:MAG: thiol:disulfide interchange protein DsbA/DsbL [Burkholderiaceae bacterium]